MFLFLYNFILEINHNEFPNDMKQIFYVMEHLIFKYIEIGGNIPKFFWNIELIMSIYINKLSNKTESLSIARCFCNLLFNPMFYVEDNLDKIENFLNCLKETICNPYEFLNEELLIKICDLSNFIFPFEHKKKFLVKTYESLLSHLIGSYKKKKSDEEGNNVNPFFDSILTTLKLIGFDVSKYDNDNTQNNNSVYMTPKQNMPFYSGNNIQTIASGTNGSYMWLFAKRT